MSTYLYELVFILQDVQQGKTSIDMIVLLATATQINPTFLQQ